MSGVSPRGRLEGEYFDTLYAEDPDPWGFATRAYERDKYAHSLAALRGRRFAQALEVGCSIGVFTVELAAHCDAVVAVDISAAAVRTARERTRSLDHVTVLQRSLPEETPAGPFDLVVCSEVLYYWPPDVLRDGLDALTARLSAGGLLLAVHWTEPTEVYPLQGDEVHAIVRAHAGLDWVHGEDRPHYRLDLLERA